MLNLDVSETEIDAADRMAVLLGRVKKCKTDRDKIYTMGEVLDPGMIEGRKGEAIVAFGKRFSFNPAGEIVRIQSVEWQRGGKLKCKEMGMEEKGDGK